MATPAPCALARLAALALTIILTVSCQTWHRMIVNLSPAEAFKPELKSDDMKPIFDGPDATRKRIPIRFLKVVGGFEQPTDLQFVPEADQILVVLEKTGKALWVNLKTGRSGQLLKVDVLTDSEQGLLGLAFHPQFSANGKFYIDSTVRSGGRDVTRIAEWRTTQTPDGGLAPAQGERVILEVVQPYANHNGGQMVFDATGNLLITFGDGGWRLDPHGNGQNLGALLGKIVRIDVDHPSGGRAYGIPADNPYLHTPGARSEVWAMGMRNPWRASLDAQGRLIAGDVGQELWEEVDVIEPGHNYGWNIREGRHCMVPAKNCQTEGLWEPLWEYPHGEEGQSVTGGVVYTGTRIPELTGKYVFGDFISGRLWALDLPAKVEPDTKAAEIYALGHFPMLPVAFGRNAAGDVFVADFGMGSIFALMPVEDKNVAERSATPDAGR